MRMITIAALSLMPCFAMADTITVYSQPNEVRIFPGATQVTRVVTFEMPAGQHTILFPDLPEEVVPSFVDVHLEGAQITGRSFIESSESVVLPDTSERYLAAKANVDAAHARYEAVQDQVKTAEAQITAANGQIDFLNGLSKNEGLPDGADTLRDLSRMVFEETAKAQSAIIQAQAKIRGLKDDLEQLGLEVDNAAVVLDTVATPREDAIQMSLSANVPTAGSVTANITYIMGTASWYPNYRMDLITGDSPSLSVDRFATIQQRTGENWNNVTLSLSTLSPTVDASPSRPFAQRLRIEAPVQKLSVSARSLDADALKDGIIEAPVIIEEAQGSTPSMAGPGTLYEFPQKVSLLSGFTQAQLALGTLTFTPELSAEATPRVDSTAFRKVLFTNDSTERLLQSQYAVLYVDGRLMGDTEIETIEPTQEANLFFGPIDGLLVSRTVLDRNEGDRGFVTRSNENSEDIRIDIENLTDRAWDVAVFDGVPYGEQEDLVIDWTASPKPDQINDDDRRGILRWDLNAAAGSKQSISIKTKITWPEGLELR
ncbi:mucoidy inhibitor MuiA family protein [Ascidiaceihabitans sp.]|uniref:mucoidy inhibitor MuiA family protein n=1 Tax=Ascidiaceihabitans sp. TaxID=1872644 RepID=UPI003297436F